MQQQSQNSTKRDPRIDPKAGDVLEKMGKRLLFVRRVRRIYGVEVYYQDGNQQVCVCFLKAWRRWAKNAEVIHVGE